MKVPPATTYLVSEALALLSLRAVSDSIRAKKTQEEISALTATRWQCDAEKLERQCRTAEELYALLLVRLVSSVLGKSIELADGRHEAAGIACPLGTSIHDYKEKPKHRKGKQTYLSKTDKDEINGEVARVLSYRNAWQRPLVSEDWSLCFSRVQSSDCLDLNRRWKRLENREAEELTLELLAQPTCDSVVDKLRLKSLAKLKVQTIAELECASKIDPSRKAKSILLGWKKYLDALCEGTEGNGQDKRERRRDRALFRAYLTLGKQAFETQALRKGEVSPLSPLDKLVFA